jgi:Spy/CpxP family protein refolding chaperone
MSKTKKIIIGSLIGITTFAGLATYVAAGDSSQDLFSGMHHKGSEFIAKKLDLDKQQKQNLDSLKQTMQQLHQGNSPREAIKALLSDPKLNQEKLVALLEKRADNLKASAPTVASAIAGFTDSLDDKQRAKIQEIMDKFGKFPPKDPNSDSDQNDGDDATESENAAPNAAQTPPVTTKETQ